MEAQVQHVEALPAVGFTGGVHAVEQGLELAPIGGCSCARSGLLRGVAEQQRTQLENLSIAHRDRRTKTPRLRTGTTSPRPVSVRMASRIGPRLVPMRSASAASLTRSPGAMSPL